MISILITRNSIYICLKLNFTTLKMKFISVKQTWKRHPCKVSKIITSISALLKFRIGYLDQCTVIHHPNHRFHEVQDRVLAFMSPISAPLRLTMGYCSFTAHIYSVYAQNQPTYLVLHSQNNISDATTLKKVYNSRPKPRIL